MSSTEMEKASTTREGGMETDPDACRGEGPDTRCLTEVEETPICVAGREGRS